MQEASSNWIQELLKTTTKELWLLTALSTPDSVFWEPKAWLVRVGGA